MTADSPSDGAPMANCSHYRIRTKSGGGTFELRRLRAAARSAKPRPLAVVALLGVTPDATEVVHELLL